jgi:lysine-arginine-ornithine-binding protein
MAMTSFKWLLTLGMAVLVAAGVAHRSNAGDWSTIKIGTEGAYAPFNYHDAAGKLQGFDIDIVQALCDRMHAKCEFIAIQFDGIIPALQNGQIDAIATSMAITEKRKKVVDFTDRYWIRHARFLSCSPRKIEDISPAALKGVAIGTQQGTVSDDFLEATYKDADVRLYKTMDDAYQDASAGRIDLVLSGEAVSYDFMQKPAGKNCRYVGERLPDGKFFGAGCGIAVRKTDPDLRDKLNAALKEILADGTYQKINAKYFPFSIY